MKTIIINGKIYTPNGYFKSILIEDNIIKKISKDNLIDIDAKIVDAKEKLVLPGFNDSHLHLFYVGTMMSNINLFNATSIEEVIEISKEHLKNNPTKKLIIADGYNQDKFVEKRLLTKYDLDKISTNIPLVFNRVCGHKVSVNSKALELAGITNSSKIVGGVVEIDENNELTGILSENAINLLNSIYSPYTVEEVKAILIKAIDYANKSGLTSIQPNDISLNDQNYKTIYEAYNSLREEKQLNIRVSLQATFMDVEELNNFINLTKNDDFLKIGTLKLFIDGSLGAKTASMINGYKNDQSNLGIVCIPENELDEIVQKADEYNIPVIIHAIGDNGIKLCIDAFSKVIKGKNIKRHGIVHCQITNQLLLDRIKELGIYIYAQPIFIDYDMSIVFERVDDELANTSYAFKTLYNNTILSMSTDAPVEDLNPFRNIYCAVTRKNIKGDQVYNKNEALTLEEAIEAYTYKSAMMTNDHDKKGLIKEGYFADLIIVDDLFEMNIEDIKTARVYMTIVDGKIIE